MKDLQPARERTQRKKKFPSSRDPKSSKSWLIFSSLDMRKEVCLSETIFGDTGPTRRRAKGPLKPGKKSFPSRPSLPSLTLLPFVLGFRRLQSKVFRNIKHLWDDFRQGDNFDSPLVKEALLGSIFVPNVRVHPIASSFASRFVAVKE